MSTNISAPAAYRRSESLAFVFQEILTATVRLRSNRQAVSDAEQFRASMREALKTADQEGRKRGYSGDDLRLAIFAVIAFLDESVLNSANPVFAQWPRKPMQEELFGGHVAGETFFQNIDALMRRPDSAEVADVLEIYDLCLLLGYQGRYTLGNRGELRSIKESIADKIFRIRQDSGGLSPAWAPPTEGLPATRDPVMRWLLYAAIACFTLACLLFIGYKISLSSGVSELREMARTIGV
ncbi:MAG: DotU family type IV/VI secretion system protein [Candidatus Acidiferrum sp.]